MIDGADEFGVYPASPLIPDGELQRSSEQVHRIISRFVLSIVSRSTGTS